ncbi:MAG: GNAT family N-acetyltransferase, partial [Rhodospirillales bacterium]|nr:GNAT family N-acetyltransferase [Rhodospirillales bacterium]
MAADISAIRKLCRKVYGDIDAYTYTQDQLRGQMASFPDGQFVATFDDTLVGYCASFQIDEETAFAPHSWSGITGNGFAARHDPEGDWLYGMEVFVDPDYRGHRIGQRLYSMRKNLATEMRLKGVVFGGRIPSLAKRWKTFGSAEAYIQAVNEKKVRDSVLSFQMRNGFEVIGVLKDYWPED